MAADGRGLTLSEVRVARLVAEGRTDEEIGARLGISVVDVDSDLIEVLRKLDLRSRTELALLLLPPMEAQGPGDDNQPGESLA